MTDPYRPSPCELDDLRRRVEVLEAKREPPTAPVDHDDRDISVVAVAVLLSGLASLGVAWTAFDAGWGSGPALIAFAASAAVLGPSAVWAALAAVRRLFG